MKLKKRQISNSKHLIEIKENEKYEIHIFEKTYGNKIGTFTFYQGKKRQKEYFWELLIKENSQIEFLSSQKGDTDDILPNWAMIIYEELKPEGYLRIIK